MAPNPRRERRYRAPRRGSVRDRRRAPREVSKSPDTIVKGGPSRRRSADRWEPPVRSRTVARASGAVASSQREPSMLRRVQKLFWSESGQGMSEYLIIVALIAVAAIGVVSIFGKDIRELFSASTDSLAGNSATSNATKATVKKKTLKNFGTNSA